MISKSKKHETEEEKFIRLFNLGFEQVVAPAMENMEEELKLEMKGLKKEMEQGFEKVNAKIDSHDRRTDNLATQVGDHEKRLKKLESKRVITA